MTDATTKLIAQAAAAPLSEDRRHPKARMPYMLLWLAVAGCVVFALITMFLQQ